VRVKTGYVTITERDRTCIWLQLTTNPFLPLEGNLSQYFY
jgi:hypothetical protein